MVTKKTEKGDCAIGFKFVGIIESVLPVGTPRPFPLNLLSLSYVARFKLRINPWDCQGLYK